MAKAIVWAVLAVVLCYASGATAATIVLRPNSPLSALPGETIGWGYDISADPDRDLEFLSSFVDLPADSGDVVDLFDFPSVPAGTSVQVDYDPGGPSGLLQLTLSPLLSAGDSVVARVFLDYLLIDPLGVRPDEAGVFELQATALVSPTGVPEPASLSLLLAALGALAVRRGVSIGRREGATFNPGGDVAT